MQYIALGAAPGIAICLFIFYKDIYNREPKFNLVLSFILGALSVVTAIIFETFFAATNDGTVMGVALYTFFVVGFSEEGGKFLGLRLYSYSRKSFDDPFDGIVYSVMVSMGFATLENVLYVTKYAAMGQGWQIGIQRMFLSVPAHASFAVIMGYFVGKAKFAKTNKTLLMIIGLVGAIFFHGAFDFFLFVGQTGVVSTETGGALLVGGAIVSFIVALVLSRKLIKAQRLDSKVYFDAQNNSPNV